MEMLWVWELHFRLWRLMQWLRRKSSWRDEPQNMMLSYVQGVKIFVVEGSVSSHCQLLAYINNHKQSFHNTSQYITMHHSRSKPALHGRIDSQPRSSQTRASFIFYRNLGKECEDGFQLKGSCTNNCRRRMARERSEEDPRYSDVVKST